MGLPGDEDDRDKAPPLEPPVEGFEEASSPFRTQNLPIGQHLLQTGLMDQKVLSQALSRQSRSGLRLGEDLIGHGEIRPFDFYRALANQHAQPFANLLTVPPNSDLLEEEDIDFYLREQCVPWRLHNGTLSFAAVDTQKAAARLREKTSVPFLLYQTSPFDILKTVQSRFSPVLTRIAQNKLREKNSASSAHSLLSLKEKLVLLFLLACLSAATIQFPVPAFLLLNFTTGFAFIALAALRLLSIQVARQRETGVPVPQTSRTDKELPLYTIMIPLLRETAVLPILVDALQRLDYPPAKLDIKLVLEETDTQTIEAARHLKLPGNFELILVPPSFPTTKPKACNYALAFARGEFLVVYDAEDIPGPAQLREAVEAFDRHGPALACAQAPLAYYNWEENWLTRQFAMEYAAIFDLLLPALAERRSPFPLGGTSTHFRTSTLRKIGAWDAYNVTEDADLGIRLHEAGYETCVLATPTLEEANCELASWTRQRTRWLKGWMQTYIVRMRHPRDTLSQLGLRGFLIFQIVIGAFLLSALAHPLFYVAAVLLPAFGADTSTVGQLLLLLFNVAVLLVGFGAAILAGLAGAKARGLKGLGVYALTTPLYWLFISFSAYRALFQLFTKPHHWEKTVHGVSNMVPAYLARAQHWRMSRNRSSTSSVNRFPKP